ncbi:DUF6207 family protein [Streptomyces scabiei]|uniref:DUF6207 family protein n=1 Tax=Streptomyces scabiei TaxID=1930 RepID=UPI0029ACE858|nr:DUF6207 family protein [Streptomyces scabiei]MDX3166007.1 DUF6207 family protein [Streptomyces scabiei]
MGDINAGLVSEPGLAVVEIVAGDEATLQTIAAHLAGTWASTGTPVDHQTTEDGVLRGRLHLNLQLPPPGTVRKLPADWVRLASPPWGARLGLDKPGCVRARADGRPCTRQAAEWPEGFVEVDDVGACWSHLDETEREWCLRAREAYRAAFWELKRAHREAAGHDRNEQCEGCTGAVLGLEEHQRRIVRLSAP